MTSHRSSSPQTPGTAVPQVRPPCDGIDLPLPGVADPSISVLRRTAQQRTMIAPQPEAAPEEWYAMTDPYVRRFWVAAIGPGAVADLLRLAAAAQSDRSLRSPINLSTLVRYGLVRHLGGTVLVPDRVPPLPPDLRNRLRPGIRHEALTDLRRRSTV